MTSKEYTQWLKGFLDAIDGYNLTKKQFDTIREKLKEVNDLVDTSFGKTATYGYGTLTYNPSTSTTYGYPSGSAWHYTNTNEVTTTGVSVFDNSNEEESELLLD